jgi:hemerythrin superfamily protein
MKEFIKKWKAEHSAIRNALASITRLDISAKPGREKVIKAKGMILEHLKSEDEVLYPALKKSARKNLNLTRVLEILKKEMDDLAPKIKSFFKAFEDDPMATGLPSEFISIAGLLKARIDREEEVLLKEYEDKESY